MADRRVARWEARRWLREWSSIARVKGCGTRVIVSPEDAEAGIDPAVRIVFGGEMEAAGVRGLSACGSVWACPRCAARIASGRAEEIRAGFVAAADLGYVPMMMTRTAGHPVDWPLEASWAAVLASWRSMTSHRVWKGFRTTADVLGTIRATEVTLSPRAGWHVHLHTLILVGDTDKAFIAEVGAGENVALRDLWASRADAHGLTVDPRGQGLQVGRDPDALGAYVVKSGVWDVASEAALGAVKDGRSGSASPFGLLASAVRGDAEAARRWADFESASRGKSALTWSRGLRSRLGITALSDDDFASASGDGHEVGRIDPATWRELEGDPALLVEIFRGVEAGLPFGTFA